MQLANVVDLPAVFISFSLSSSSAVKMEFHTGETTAASTLASASMATSTMPNVEHLLQNYKVADVLHIQRRLKGDVEKRKADLKALIG